MSVIYGTIPAAQTSITDELGLMHAQLRYWEPDTESQWHNEHVGLGHLMLHNTPESLTEILPATVGELTITADCRLDNRQELFALLGLDERVLVPDSALILKLYEKFGDQCARYLIGDFAFAIWDAGKRSLFCARDHLGVKPLFYYCDGRSFAFASEIKGLLALAKVSNAVDTNYVYTILTKQFPADDETFYENINRLSPAHSLVFDSNGLKLSRYWDIDVTKTAKYDSVEEYYAAFREKFTEAVRCRLRSAFPLGAQLSGGLDSSIIVCVADSLLKASQQKLDTYSFVLADEDKQRLNEEDEQQYIDVVNQWCTQTISHKIARSNWKNTFDELDRELFVDSGFELSSSGWQEAIRESANNDGVRVLLSGYPGDECVTNTGSSKELSYLDKKQFNLFFAKGSKIERLKLLARHSAPGLARKVELSAAFNAWRNRKIKKEYNFVLNLSKPLSFRFYHSDLYLSRNRSYRHMMKFKLFFTHIQRMEAETRYGIAHKIEPRFPMADVRLVEFIMSLPDELKYDENLKRPFFRRATVGMMPEEVRLRLTKSGTTLAYSHVETPVQLFDMYKWLQALTAARPELKLPVLHIPVLETGADLSLVTVTEASMQFSFKKLVRLARFEEGRDVPAAERIFK